MAIDTVAKRSSVQAYTLGLVRPPPDNSVDEGDRATAAWLYAGHDYDVPVQAATGGTRRQVIGGGVGRMMG